MCNGCSWCGKCKIIKRTMYNENNKDYVFYETKNKEYFLLRENKSYYFYDFTDLNQRKMIEFNGDVFHANPNIFNETDTPHPYYKNLTSKAKNFAGTQDW